MASEEPNTLGQYLRQERERRGITIEQIASATKISVRLLHSLEGDQFSELPAKPFIRGFVNSYARFLNLDPKELLTRYGDFIDSKASERPNRDGGHSGYAFERKEGDHTHTGLWMLMGSFLVLGAVAIFVFKPSFRHHRKSHVERLRGAGIAGASPFPEGVSASGVPAGLVSEGVNAPSAVNAPPAAAPVVSPLPAVQGVVPPAAHAVIAVISPSPTPELVKVLAPIPQVAKPSPSAAPRIAVAEPTTPVASPEPNRRADPLNAGKDLFKNEVNVKVVIKALEDQWVRYKVDEKPLSRLILRKGVILVLLGKEAVSFQVSNPKTAAFVAQRGKSGSLQMVRSQIVVGDYLQKFKPGKTQSGGIVFPFEMLETKGDPFSGEHPLSSPPAPPSRAASDPAPDDT